MKDSHLQLIDIGRLKVGMFIHLDLSWTEHPFPFGSFKIKSEEQIGTIRELGLERVRWSPEKSEPGLVVGADDEAAATEATATPEPPPPAAEVESEAKRMRRESLLAQQASLERCERQFSQASKSFRNLLQCARSRPQEAAAEVKQLVDSMVGDMTGEREVAIRLLSEKAGEETSLHALNVTVLSVLLGRASGLDAPTLQHIGLGALLHDIGKIELPDRLRWADSQSTPAERKLFRSHVEAGVALVRKMNVPAEVADIVAQHHELADGSGYPQGIKGAAMSIGARVVSLVNQYDDLCNPGNPAQALTPHDALAVMFARQRTQFDSKVMAVFIRMMGVYPPGSVVQLTDQRFGLSVAVNPLRPLKPRVVVFDDVVPPEQALILDLEEFPELGVQRSLKPLQLPRAVFDYLSPRKRMCYFFERSRDPGELGSPV